MRTKKIKLPRHLGPLQVERIISTNAIPRKTNTNFIIDFSNLEWASVYAISLLYDWFLTINSDDHSCFEIIGHLGGHEGTEYLHNIGFLRNVETLARKSTKPPAKNWKLTPGQFSIVESQEDLVTYQNLLGNPAGYRFLTKEDSNLPILKSGDFRNVLFRELGDNAMTHGNGSNVRCCMAVSKSVTGFDSKDVYWPNNSAAIELIVSDNGPGLVNQLEEYRKEGFCPDYLETTENLDPSIATILYAFEFDTTSDANRRARLFEKMNAVSDFDPSIVPTGLFYLRSLVAAYRGRVTVRTDNWLVTLNFTGNGEPIVCRQSVGKQALHSVSGTHIFVQIPARNRVMRLERDSTHQTSVPWSALGTTEHVNLQVLIDIRKDESEQFGDITENIRKKLEILRLEKQATLLISAANLTVQTKVFGALLPWLLIVPRSGTQIVIDWMSISLFEAARAQYQHLGQFSSERPDALVTTGASPFWLVSYDQGAAINYGAPITDADQALSTAVEKEDLSHLRSTSVKALLSSSIQSPPVKQVDYYFLIEGAYYTETFYEIRRLLNSDATKEFAARYLSNQISEHDSTIVLSLAHPMDDLVVAATSGNEDIKVLLSKRANSVAAATHVSAISGQNTQSKQKILVVTDVVCSGNTLKAIMEPFLDSYSSGQLKIVVFVDSRDTPRNYIVLESDDAATSVKVDSILRTTIETIDDLPAEPTKDVLIVDPVTRVPTRYYAPLVSTKSLKETLELACQSQSLIEGHIELHSTHFQYYLNLRRFLPAIHSEIEMFWEAQLQSITALTPGPDEVALFYTEDVAEWNAAVKEFATKYTFGHVAMISREVINSPSAMPDREVYDTIWVLMPVMATAKSIRRVLAYVSNMKPKYIHISIALSRMPQDRMSFYQDITGYGVCRNVSTKIFASLPLPTHSRAASCPLCEFDRRLSEAAITCWTFPALRACLESFREPLRKQDASEFTAAKREDLSIENRTALHLRSFFEGSYWQWASRKAIGAVVKGKDGKDAFLRMIGKAFLSWTFTEPRFKRGLYSHREDILKRAKDWLLGTDIVPIDVLTGVHAFDRETLKDLFSQYLANAFGRGDAQELANVLGFSLAFAEDYGPICAGFLHGADIRALKSQLLMEAVRYPYWDGFDKAHEAESIWHLRWLLLRSTSWGDNLSHLRQYIDHANPSEETRQMYADFVQNGAGEAVRLLTDLRTSILRLENSLWQTFITELSDGEETIRRLKEAVASLPTDLSGDEDIVSILSTLDTLDVAGKALSNGMDRLYFNPSNVEINLKSEIERRLPNIIMEVDVHEDQPGILITKSAMFRMLFVLAENFDRELRSQPHTDNSQKNKLNVSFCGPSESASRSTMRVATAIRWSKPGNPEGGLVDLVKMCNRFGAYYDFGSAQGGAIAIHFRADSKRLHYG